MLKQVVPVLALYLLTLQQIDISNVPQYITKPDGIKSPTPAYYLKEAAHSAIRSILKLEYSFYNGRYGDSTEAYINVATEAKRRLQAFGDS